MNVWWLDLKLCLILVKMCLSGWMYARYIHFPECKIERWRDGYIESDFLVWPPRGSLQPLWTVAGGWSKLCKAPSPSPQHPLYKTLEGSTGPSWVKQCGQGGQGLLLAGLCEAWSEQIPRGRDMGGWDGNGCWWARGLLCLQMEKSIMVKFL